MDVLLDYADVVMKESSYHENMYFQLLTSDTITTNWFRRTQEPFIHAVNGWSRLLANLLSRLHDPEQRSVILNNLNDEHGKGDKALSHVSTFLKMLQSCGSSYESYETIPHNKDVDDFIFILMNIESVEALVGAIGMIEYGYAYISQTIADSCRKANIPISGHYNVHSDLDMDHAEGLFSLVVSKVSSMHSCIRDGMKIGWCAFLKLYTCLANVMDHNIKFANVIEDSQIEISILKNIRQPRICMVGSAGCSLFSILREQTGICSVDVVDSNPEQIHLIALKLAALKTYVKNVDKYRKFLSGGLTVPEVNDLVCSIDDKISREYWLSRFSYVLEGISKMGTYEHLFQVLKATNSFEVAFDPHVLTKLFGPAVTECSSSPLDKCFQCKLSQSKPTPYFSKLLRCRYDVSPPYLRNDGIILIGEELAKRGLTITSVDMTSQLASKHKAYDFINISNINDWLLPLDFERLMLSCRQALTDDGILLIRRINGKISLNLEVYGFEMKDVYKDQTGLYECASFLKAKLPKREELSRFEALTQATYPLGQDRFRIKHGNDYLYFFKRMGELIYRTIRDENGDIIATSAIVLTNQPGLTRHATSTTHKSWYIGDLRVAPAHQGKGLSLSMFAEIAQNGLQRCSSVFAVEMGSGDSTILKLVQRANLTQCFGMTTLSVYMIPRTTCLQNIGSLSLKYGDQESILLSLQGHKDIILESSGPMKLYHLYPRSSLCDSDRFFELNELETLENEAVICTCAVQDSNLDKTLSSIVSRASLARAVHKNMPFADWDKLSTAEI